MADSTIFDLTPETVLTSSHEFVAQDTSAATRAQAVPYSLMGGLEYTTSGDAAISAAVGKLYYVDVGSFTADRVLTLPATAAVGERVGVFVSTGDDTYELGIQANTGDTLNGVAAATDWSRLFISNECVIMRCVVADTTWIVEYDGRIASAAQMTSANDNSVSSATWTDIVFASGDDEFNVGNVIDYTINTNVGGFVARRAGRYRLSLNLDQAGAMADNKQYGASFKVNGTQESANFRQTVSTGAAVKHRAVFGALRDFSAGDTVGLMVYDSETTPPDFGAVFSIQEIR